jgi:Flp pilus assembly protein TadG
MQPRSKPRSGAAVAEFAIVLPVINLLIVGTVVAALGMYRYSAVAELAREGSRWASVHGTQYAQDTGKTAATKTDVYNNAIAPLTVGFDTSKLTYDVTWNTSNSPYHTKVVNGQVTAVTNTVTVTVSYTWVPEAIFPSVTLSSSSTSIMSN